MLGAEFPGPLHATHLGVEPTFSDAKQTHNSPYFIVLFASFVHTCELFPVLTNVPYVLKTRRSTYAHLRLCLLPVLPAVTRRQVLNMLSFDTD
jgi:hypothetical protein